MNDDLTTVERKGRSRKIVHAKSAYESEELREQYVRLTEKAQDLYLAKDFKGAKRCALMAIRIRPTSHLFGLCAALAEAVGNFNEAADFRLLQAFQANDVELWRELLNEFLENNLWFKATVCLKRLSALAPPRSKERHDIQLQLADLLVALGEHRPATTIYRNLWVQSDMKDFEVFATLSSLLFQLGRWNALDELLRESTTVFLKKEIAKQICKDTPDHADDDHYAENDDDGDEGIMGLGRKRGRDQKEKPPSTSGATGVSSGVIDALLKGSGVTAEELRKKSAAAGSASASSSGEPQSKMGLRIEGKGMKGGDMGVLRRDPNDVDANNFDSFDDLFGENGDYLLSGGDRRDEVFLGGSGVSTTTSTNLLSQGGADSSALLGTDGYEDASGLVPDRSTFDDHLADDAAVSAVALAGTGAANNDMDFDFTGTGGGGGGPSIDVLSRPSTAPVKDPFIELTSPEDIRNYLSLMNVHTELLNERGQFSSTVQLILLAASHLRMAVLDMNADILLKLAIAYAHMGSLSAAEEVVKRLVDTCSPNDYGDVLFDAAETLSKLGAFALSSTIYKYLLRFSRMTDENSVGTSATPDGAGDGATAPAVVGLSPRYSLRKGETLDMLRDRLDRDVALLFGIARCEANSEPFAPYQWHLVQGLPTPPILSPTGFGPGSGGSSAFPNSASASSQAQQAYALARKHPAIAALLEIHEQLDPFHVPTRLLLSQLFRHEFRNYEAAEKVLLPPKALFSPEAFSKSSASSSLFVDPSTAGGGPQSLGNLNAMMAQFALNNDPSLLRESGLQRTQCDAELMLVYGDLGPRRALDLLKCGVPFFDRLLTTAAGDDEDAESVVAGGKKSRAPSLSLPGLSRASSAIVPASRVAGSLSGDNGPATSSLLSTTRSIATSARSSAAGGKLMLRTRGVSAGSSYITSSATTALTVAGSRVGPASSVAEMMEAKDSTGIFRFHRTSAAMRKAVVGSGRGGGGGGGGKGGAAAKDIASVGKRIRKTVNKMDLQNGSALRGEGGDGGAGAGGVRDAADLLMEIAGDGQKPTSTKKGSANQSRRYEHMKASRAKAGAEGGGAQKNAVIATRSEILAHEVPYHTQKSKGWEVSSVGNLGDIALMEEVMGDDHLSGDEEEGQHGDHHGEDKTENTAGKDVGDDGDESKANDNATDRDGFLLPSAGPRKDGSSGSQKPKAVAEVVDDAIPSIDDVIALNFAADPMMAELFRSVTEGGKKEAGSDVSQSSAADTFGDDDATPQTVYAKVEAQTFSSPLTTATTAATGKGKAPAPGGKKGAKTVAAAPAQAPPAPAPAQAPVTASLPVSQPIPASAHDKRPIAQEYVRLFGKSRLIRLALLMMDAYSHLGDHTESKNFGVFFVLRMKDFFRRGGELATPIRLAVLRQSLLSGDVTSAVSNTLTILRLEGRIEDPSKSLFGAGRGSGAAGAAGGDDNAASSSTTSGSALSSSVGAAAASGLLVGTVHQRHLWETFAVLVNRGLKTRILNRLVTDKGRRDFEIMCIIGNTHYNAGTYLLALRFYMIALEQRPRDPLLLFLIGICYLQQSTRRTDSHKNSNIQNAFYYLQEYYQVVASDTPSCIPEATYNIARAYHFLSLYYLAEPLYVRTITMLEQEGVGRFRIISAAAAAEAEPSPFAPSGGSEAIAKRQSGGLGGANGDMASSFYGFINAKDDEAPQIDSSIRKGFGLHEGMTPAMRMREHHLRQEMLLQAARFNLSLIYKKSGPSDMIPLKTMTSVLY